MQTITKILFFGSLGIASFFALFIFVGMQLSNPLIDDPRNNTVFNDFIHFIYYVTNSTI